jgi:hypothetical protein
MHYRTSVVMIALLVAAVPAAFAASSVEKIRNEKVLVTENTLSPGGSETPPGTLPSMIVYLVDGTAQTSLFEDKPYKETVKAGETVFQPAEAGRIKNAGLSPLHFVRIKFLTTGSPHTWGMSGLSPHYVMLLENQYARAYDIKIPAQTFEPQHTHHDRVVVCLSGAQLEHILPTGEIQPSTLKTGEVVWRLGATHTGHNLGQTNLWVIAVEPK